MTRSKLAPLILTLLSATLLIVMAPARAQQPQQKSPTDLRGVLLEQLHTTHDKEDWFVPAKIALEGLTADEASWRDGKENHSIGQLAYHLLFWDKRALQRFNGEKQENFSGNNNETFEKFDAKQWDSIVKQLDEVLTAWEKAVQAADDKKLAENADLIAHIGAHNAYHIGQIIYIRKQQGSWDPAKGVR